MSDTTGGQLRTSVAEEVRVWLARRRMSGVKLAGQIGRSQAYVSRRLTGETAFDIDDLERIANALDVNAVDLLPRKSGEATVGYSDKRDPLAARVIATVGEPKVRGSLAVRKPSPLRAVRARPDMDVVRHRPATSMAV